MRNVWLDILRGVAILIVVFGHALQVIGLGEHQLVLRIIRMFQMELFFSISGYAIAYSKVMDPILGCKKAFMRLAVPYLSWVTMSVISLCITSGFPGVSRVFEIYAFSQFWFLRELFVVVALFWVSRYCHKISHQLFVYFGSLLSVSLVPHCDTAFKYGICFYFINAKTHDIVEEIDAEWFVQSWLGKFLVFLGVSSLGIYAVHLNILYGFVDHHLYNYSNLLSTGVNEYVLGLVIAVAWVIVSLAMIFVIRRSSFLKRIFLGE